MKRRQFLQKTSLTIPSLALSSSLLASCSGKEQSIVPIQTDKEVIIIGAGISGLAAAKVLNDRKIKVTVIEAQEKVGGRLRTDRTLGVPFDEGASWIHGPKGNPLTDLAKNAGANTFLTNDDSLAIFDTNGSQYSDRATERAYKDYENSLKEVQNKGKIDQSFQQVFGALYPSNLNDRLWKYMLSAYLEFDTGSDISELSSLDFYDDEAYNGEDVIITNGYDTIANYLARGLNVKLNERVSSIDYSGEKVNIIANQQKHSADFVIITVPLGVLKQNVIAFNPPLPLDKQQAISKTNMSAVNKFLLIWDNIFWNNDLQYIGFTPETKGKFNYFLNVKKFVNTNGLMTFAFGNYGKQTEQITDSQIIIEIMGNLRAIYPNAPNPRQMLRTKWSSNINSYGSYSFATNGARSTNFDIIATEVSNKVFFAGEHTNRAHRGTAHGAYESGLREANKIIKLLD
ncbi:MAG: FAD-dependent oxidoreductase [Thermoflexibacter sp.]|jgi:monoamine oxidase|nr:FAD-dependent oxidoreductase [Thermoflexibacter sp.]